MSPRGVATPDVRNRLLDAAERVLERRGAAALTARAVTAEAGCATGVLYTHFRDLDGFLVELVLDRLRRVGEATTELDRSDLGDARATLVAVGTAILDRPMLAVARLVSGRADLFQRVGDAFATGAPGFPEIEARVARHLGELQRSGGVRDGADVAAAAVAFVAALHHYLLLPRAEPPEAYVTRIVDVLWEGL